MPRDPVFYDPDQEAWFFYDEIWANALGPFDTEEEARVALQKYVEELG